MQDHIDRIEEEKTFIEEIEVTIKSLIDTIEDKPVIKKKLEKTKNIRQELDTVLRGYLKDLNFYHDNDNCPTCKQGIDHNFKETIIDERNQKKREAEDGMDGIEIKITELEARIEEISKVEDVIQSHNLKIGEHRAQIKMSMNALKSFKNDLDAAEKEVEEVDTSKLEEFNKTLKDLQNDQVKLFDERETLGVAAAMLKDGGIKTRIIRLSNSSLTFILTKTSTKLLSQGSGTRSPMLPSPKARSFVSRCLSCCHGVLSQNCATPSQQTY